MNGCMYGGEKGGPDDAGYQAYQTHSCLEGGHERGSDWRPLGRPCTGALS